MPYAPTNWVDGVTPINAANLNKLETAVSKAPYGPDATAGQTATADGAGGWTYALPASGGASITLIVGLGGI